MKVIDMHCDTISTLWMNKEKYPEYTLRKNDYHINLEKMQKGDYLIQNFAMFVHLRSTQHPFEHCHDLIDLYYQEIEKNADLIEPIFSYDDILRVQKQNKMGALLTIEEGGVTEGSLVKLRQFYRLGVRMLTLTWNFENGIGYPNFTLEEGQIPDFKQPDTQHGLTPFGIKFVQEMEKLGMIIDVSHLSDAGFYDVLKYTKKPFVASHSNARGVCEHCRNMSDDMIRQLAKRGGVMGINFCGDFLEEASSTNQGIRSTVKNMVKHILYIKEIGGIDCIGLGSDYDGIERDIELRYCSMLPHLEQALYEAGFNEEEVAKIFYQNVLRVYREILK